MSFWGQAQGRAKVTVRCLLRFMGRLLLWLDIEYGSDMRVSVRLSFRVPMRHG